MPKAMPEEFRRRAVELTRQEGARVPQIAKDLGISDSCLRRWIQQAEVEEGTREGLTSSMDPESETGNYRFKSSCRFSFGWSDWRGAYGANGA